MKKICFFLITFLMLNLQSYATTWVQVGDYEYIDKDSIVYYTNDHGEIQFNKKKFWLKAINDDEMYKDIEKLLNKKVSYCINQWIIDTTKKTYVIKSGTLYDEKGNVVSSYSFKDYELNWNPIVPGSKGEYWFELVKKPRYLKKMYKIQSTKQYK